ncbi:MAG: hypothetical protein IT190_10225, partial [Microbacteriaceae bacterium]|nr:hypothetical protein [Microbacteriaceae bacterium]
QLEQFDQAQLALAKAALLLQQKAGQISDPAMRASFLQHVRFNRQIQTAVAGQSSSER